MYAIQNKGELIQQINVFLNDSVVLPPGEYGADQILPMNLQVWRVAVQGVWMLGIWESNSEFWSY